MHLIADAADIEDHVVLAIAVDHALELADHVALLDRAICSLHPCGGGLGRGITTNAGICDLPLTLTLSHKGREGNGALHRGASEPPYTPQPSYAHHLQPKRRAGAMMACVIATASAVSGIG